MLTRKEVRIAIVVILVILVASQFVVFWGQQLSTVDYMITDYTGQIIITDKKSDVSPSDAHAVFFNVYFSGKKETLELTKNSTYEQMEQIASSYAAQHSLLSSGKRLPVYYNTLGSPNSTGTMQTICQDKSIKQFLECHYMDHYNQGFEEVTLSKLHDYCTDNPTHKVTYLHNKGSHNAELRQNQLRQDVWRRHGTAAALSQQCKNANPDKKIQTTNNQTAEQTQAYLLVMSVA